MNTTIRLLDALKSSGLGTDYAIAKHFKRTRSNVSRWRHGMDQMNDDMAIQVAEHLGIDPVEVLAELRIERGQTEAERKYWEQWREDFRISMRLKSDEAVSVEKITRHSRWRGIQISKEHLIFADGTKIHPGALMNVANTVLLCAQLNRQHSDLQLRVWKLENALRQVGGNWRAALAAVK